MKELIVQALNNAIILLDKRVPQTKHEVIYTCIDDVKPCEIQEFMKDNYIPDDAWFGGRPNGYDAFDAVCLCHEIIIPTTDKEKLKFKRNSFSSVAFKAVFDLLLVNGYKRVGFNSALMKPFNGTTVYDMYINKEFDRLVEYYSLSFIKVV